MDRARHCLSRHLRKLDIIEGGNKKVWVGAGKMKTRLVLCLFFLVSKGRFSGVGPVGKWTKSNPLAHHTHIIHLIPWLIIKKSARWQLFCNMQVEKLSKKAIPICSPYFPFLCPSSIPHFSRTALHFFIGKIRMVIINVRPIRKITNAQVQASGYYQHGSWEVTVHQYLFFRYYVWLLWIKFIIRVYSLIHLSEFKIMQVLIHYSIIGYWMTRINCIFKNR